ncbi:MAG TPA: cytochrome c [Terriglobales bacterium]|jgi:mono/diheme cytochrome c family protein|nr:cytochrome c [Terriglobales bacterium]
MKYVLVVLGLLMSSIPAWLQETQPAPSHRPPAEYKIPADAAKQTNPVKPTSESLAKAKRTYNIDCAMCHGKEGDGKGDVGADMKLKVSDFTNPATLKDYTDGEIFHIIKNGAVNMPPEGDRVKAEELWNLVNYVRSFAKKGAATEEKAASQ